MPASHFSTEIGTSPSFALAVLRPFSDVPHTNVLNGGVIGDVLYEALVPKATAVISLDLQWIGLLAAVLAVAGLHVALGGSVAHQFRSTCREICSKVWSRSGVSSASQVPPRAAAARPKGISAGAACSGFRIGGWHIGNGKGLPSWRALER